MLTIVKSAAIGGTTFEFDRDDVADRLVDQLDWDADCAHGDFASRIPRSMTETV